MVEVQQNVRSKGVSSCANLRSYPGRRLCTGFTVTELLVAITIVALLVAALAGAVSTARDRARDFRCINNMKQIGVSMQLYTFDNKNQLPPFYYKEVSLGGGRHSLTNDPNWSLTSIGPGASFATLACPMDKNPTEVDVVSAGKTNSVPISYTYNYLLYLQGVSVTGVKLQSTALLFDGKPDQAALGSWWDTPTSEPGPDGLVVICHQPGTPAEQTLSVPPSALGGHLGHGDSCGPCGVVLGIDISQFPNLPTLTRRHTHRGNVLFLDCHVEQITTVSTNSLAPE